MFDLITKKDSNVKNDVLSGITVALALVPEAVAFAFVAGVEPMVGLYAAFIVGLVTALFGGLGGIGCDRDRLRRRQCRRVRGTRHSLHYHRCAL